MELGLMQGPFEEERSYYEELGLRWFGIGLSGDMAKRSRIADGLVMPFKRIESFNGVAYARYADDVKYLVDENFQKFLIKVERDIRFFLKHCPVQYYEIWPEPWSPYLTQDRMTLDKYCAILKVAYETIKGYDSRITVWNGGVGQFRTLWGIQDFLHKGVHYTDALNLHLFQFGDTWEEAGSKIGGFMAQARLMLERRKIKKPLICTEWGYPTAEDSRRYESKLDPAGVLGLPEREQALIIASVLESFNSFDAQVFFFTFMRDAGGPHWAGHTGLRRGDNTEKPGYQMVKMFQQVHGAIPK